MTPPQPVLPDYGGPNISGLVPALLTPPGRRPAWLGEPLRSARQVVLFVVDGLGWEQLQAHLDLVPNLSRLAGGPITTVAPSTTATALTSLVVGAPPAQHGVVGYKLAIETPEGRQVMNVLKWRTASGDASPYCPPEEFQRLEAFGGADVPVVSRSDFIGSGFSLAHQKNARQVAVAAPSGLAVEAGRLLAEGTPLVYCYYDGVDRVAHYHGLGEHYRAELEALDRLVSDLLEVIPLDAALALTADHGQVEVGSAVHALDPGLLEGLALVSGEPRFLWLHASEGLAPERLEEQALGLYGHQAWVVTLDRAEREGWFGGQLRGDFRQRVGDVALVPFEPVAFVERPEGPGTQLVCRHGSLTSAEMLVPLMSGVGRLYG